MVLLALRLLNQPLLALIVLLALMTLAVNALILLEAVRNPLASVIKISSLPLICLSVNGYCPATKLEVVCEITTTELVRFGYGINN